MSRVEKLKEDMFSAAVNVYIGLERQDRKAYSDKGTYALNAASEELEMLGMRNVPQLVSEAKALAWEYVVMEGEG